MKCFQQYELVFIQWDHYAFTDKTCRLNFALALPLAGFTSPGQILLPPSGSVFPSVKWNGESKCYHVKGLFNSSWYSQSSFVFLNDKWARNYFPPWYRWENGGSQIPCPRSVSNSCRSGGRISRSLEAPWLSCTQSKVKTQAASEQRVELFLNLLLFPALCWPITLLTRISASGLWNNEKNEQTKTPNQSSFFTPCGWILWSQ